MSETHATVKKTFSEKGPIGKGIHICAYFFAVVSISLLLSIIGEWLIMKFKYPELGVKHSQMLVEKEVQYLHENFQRKFLFERSLSDVAVNLANSVYVFLYKTSGLEAFAYKYGSPVLADEQSFMTRMKYLYAAVDDYILSAINSVQLFTVRLFVIGMSLPGFILVGYAALVDGLVRRDLRRFGGGIERSGVYHLVKSWITGPVALLPALVYLSLPVNIPPYLVFVPAIGIFGLLLYIFAATYKKYI